MLHADLTQAPLLKHPPSYRQPLQSAGMAWAIDLAGAKAINMAANEAIPVRPRTVFSERFIMLSPIKDIDAWRGASSASRSNANRPFVTQIVLLQLRILVNYFYRPAMRSGTHSRVHPHVKLKPAWNKIPSSTDTAARKKREGSASTGLLCPSRRPGPSTRRGRRAETYIRNLAKTACSPPWLPPAHRSAGHEGLLQGHHRG